MSLSSGIGRSVVRYCAALAVVAATLVPAGTAAIADSAPTTWTYETDEPGSVPAGCATPAGKAPVTVTDEQGYDSEQSLKLDDQSASSLPTIDCPRPAQQGAQLRLRAKPEVANGFMIDLTGTTTVSSGVVFHLLFRTDGSVNWYDGGRWLPVAPAGTLPQGSWSQIGVGATTDQDMVYLSVNGRTIGSAGPWGVNPVTSITGFQFAGSGTAYTGDTVYLDDVSYGKALPTRPAAIMRQFQIGALHTITSSSAPTQMPNTAVRVPLSGGGERIIASYPAHTDAAQTAGNKMVYSDDGGKTWVDDQAHNPMPDAPSYVITRLADGSLYAMNYHGYANGNLRESVIESAVSTDNGDTWTNREGILTVPQDIAPYGCERPSGCTLLVQVHNVIEDRDGTLYQSAYGKYVGDPKYRQLLLVSHDGGLNWAVQGTVAVDPDLSSSGAYEGPCEGVFVRTGLHSFLAVMRTGSYLPMYTARSDDDGKTWTPMQQMKTVTGQPVSSVFPSLERLADGSLLLMVGRPGLALLRSFDNGATWTDPVWTDYTNSANGYMLAMGGQSVMLFGDRGANWQHPNQYGVWDRLITATGRP